MENKTTNFGEIKINVMYLAEREAYGEKVVKTMKFGKFAKELSKEEVNKAIAETQTKTGFKRIVGITITLELK